MSQKLCVNFVLAHPALLMKRMSCSLPGRKFTFVCVCVRVCVRVCHCLGLLGGTDSRFERIRLALSRMNYCCDWFPFLFDEAIHVDALRHSDQGSEAQLALFVSNVAFVFFAFTRSSTEPGSQIQFRYCVCLCGCGCVSGTLTVQLNCWGQETRVQSLWKFVRTATSR